MRPLGSNPQGKSTSIRTPESPGKQAKSDDGADTSAIQQRVSEQVTDGDADPTRGKGRLGSAADVHPSPDVPSPCGAAAEREVLVSSDLGLPPDVEDILAACKAAAQLQASAALPSTGRAQTAVAAAAQPAVLNGKGKGKEVEKSPQISQGSFCSDEEGPMSDDLASSDDDGVSPDALGPTQTSMRKPSKAKSSKESPPSRFAWALP